MTECNKNYINEESEETLPIYKYLLNGARKVHNNRISLKAWNNRVRYTRLRKKEENHFKNFKRFSYSISSNNKFKNNFEDTTLFDEKFFQNINKIYLDMEEKNNIRYQA
ncbi:MAG: hypothetical protein ACNI3C_10405 [Candidatus Marinarcus sp.]|uniref:hypothetical protein n=1 Tax=Candidatus Marinarcus sp. TaxID=3100987 RepID=UPI003AFFC891